MMWAYFMPDGTIECSGGPEMNPRLAMRSHMVIRNVGEEGSAMAYAEVTKIRNRASLIVTGDVKPSTNSVSEMHTSMKLIKPENIDTSALDGWPGNE